MCDTFTPIFARDCSYDKRKDVSPVEPFGFIDLCQAYINNSLPTVVSADDTAYNNIAHPGAMFDKPRDVFELAHLERTIRDYKPSATQTEENSA